MQEICMEEELSRILEQDTVDVNLKIALVLARQLGWPIDFIVEGTSCKYVMVVPSSPFGNATTKMSAREALASPRGSTE